MTLSNTLTSWRKSLPTILRRLAIALAVALVSALAVGSSWLTHRPVGYSGDAHASSLISPDFASGFDVAWEMTSAELGTDAPIREIVNVDGTAVIFTSSLASSDDPRSGTLIGIDASGRTPTVLWRHDIHNGNMNLLIWEDSIVAGDETIRAADGAVTATWETPLPTTMRFGYYADGAAVPATLVGNVQPIKEGSRFVQVTWPVALVCAPTDTRYSFAVPTTQFTCTAWRKDGSQAWSYVTGTEGDIQRGPITTPAVNGYILAGRLNREKSWQYEADGFLNLADGTYTRGDTQDGIDAAMLFPASDGWIDTASSGPYWQDEEFVVYNPDGTERERTARSVGSRDWLRILHMTCWDTTGHIITPTAEQALETLHSEEVSWAPLCTQPPTYSAAFIGFINGRPLMSTNEDGSPETDSYPDDSILASDGSLILYPASTWTADTSRQGVSLSQPLYSAPEGVLLSNLTEVGAYGATPLYDDLLIAKPNHPDSSWHRYLGTYPHSDTVLMGITPKRAG